MFETKTVIVTKYQKLWQAQFQLVVRFLLPIITPHFLTIEHVGSTAVVGLQAKPVIDCDIIVREDQFAAIETALTKAGFTNRGDLGIVKRIAFSGPDLGFRYHLYVCYEDAPNLREHILLREYLRMHPGAKKRYGELKEKLALMYPTDINSYLDGKASMIQHYLKKAHDVILYERPARPMDLKTIHQIANQNHTHFDEANLFTPSFVMERQGKVIAYFECERNPQAIGDVFVHKTIAIDKAIPELLCHKIMDLFECRLHTQNFYFQQWNK